MGPRFFKLEIFVPETHFPLLRETLREQDAGHIGRYDSCLAYSRVRGSWRPLEGADPFIGRAGELCEMDEVKIEVTVSAGRLEQTVRAVKGAHPYEEPVINIIPLWGTGLQGAQ
ncbi:MAG: hypothetical protein II737_02610 [Mailhella sp.]|jgi:hypothetical protein|nr:hypothetical protein [Mailhella sp.]